MSFESLLIHSVDIQEFTTSTSGYETTKSWSNKSTSVPCRVTSSPNPDIEDSEIRINTDDNLVSFKPGVDIERGDRIVYAGDNYDVIKIHEVYGSDGLHHISVVARIAETT